MMAASGSLGFAAAAHPNRPALPDQKARAAATVSCARAGAGVKKKENFYKVLCLGSEKASSLQEIKKAYRSLAQQFHPDMCPAPEKREEYTTAMVEVNRAYEVLSDPVLRANHDAELGGLLPAGYRGTGRGRQGTSSMPNKGTWEAQLAELERRSALRMQRRSEDGDGGAR